MDFRASVSGGASRDERGPDDTGPDPCRMLGPECWAHPGPGSDGPAGAQQELQRLYRCFQAWLQPERRSKEDMLGQVALEQFMLNRHRSERPALRRRWEASGGDLDRFLEGLSEVCLRPPGLVHVHMQGQEALFSENMPLREVIVHLTKQLAAAGAPRAPQDAALDEGPGSDHEGDGGSGARTTACPASGISACPAGEGPSLVIVGKEVGPWPGEGGGASEGPLSARRPGLGHSGPQEGAPGAPPSQAGPVQGSAESPSRPAQGRPERVSPARWDMDGGSPQGSKDGSPQGGEEGPPRPYRCEACPKTFRQSSQLRAHLGRHRSEKAFVCAECGRGFVRASDLRVHARIHAGEKPFQCRTCQRPFSHRTNLLAHERIHSGAKPYECGLCGGRFRQSSTYHRHLRTHQAAACRPGPSTAPSTAALG